MAVIVQTAGSKRWQLWHPPVESPMREFSESWRVWREDYIPAWEATGPDIEIDLKAGSHFCCQGAGSTTPACRTSTSPAST